MHAGIIGTGAIAEAMIIGMIEHGQFDGQLFVSKRSAERSRKLSERFPNVTVVDENQKIIDQSDWVFVSVLPEQSRELLTSLKFDQRQTIISLVAGLELEELRKICAPASKVFRIIPLPPIEFGIGPLPLCPPDEELEKFFNKFCVAISVDSEAHFTSFSAASAVMASHFELQATLARWISSNDVPKTTAAHYTTTMFRCLGELASKCDWKQLQQLPDNSQTPGGLNEQVINELRELNWFEQFENRITRIGERLRDS